MRASSGDGWLVCWSFIASGGEVESQYPGLDL
jgi:hypothetical protein